MVYVNKYLCMLTDKQLSIGCIVPLRIQFIIELLLSVNICKITALWSCSYKTEKKSNAMHVNCDTAFV